MQKESISPAGRGRSHYEYSFHSARLPCQGNGYTQNCAMSQGFTLSPHVQGRETPNLKNLTENLLL